MHLCHRYFQEVSLDEETNDPIPFAEPAPDGASAAVRALGGKGDVFVLGTAGGSDCEILRQFVLRIKTNLLDTSATREPPKGNTIYASELMDAVLQPGCGSVLKALNASKDASSSKDLAEITDVIGICADIGEIFQPIPGPGSVARTNCECLRLPQDHYLLAAHSKSPVTLGFIKAC